MSEEPRDFLIGASLELLERIGASLELSNKIDRSADNRDVDIAYRIRDVHKRCR
jgi:hypothetical protein